MSSLADHFVLQPYLRELRQLPILQAGEAEQLAQRIQRGDTAALERLIQANLRFVLSVACTYAHLPLPLPDLISEGNLGLIEAARRYDAAQGVTFLSYAVWWIRKYIRRALTRHARLIRLPEGRLESLRALRQAARQLTQQLERTPTTAELATYLGVGEDTVRALQQWSERPVSLHAPSEAASLCLWEQLPDQNASSPEQSLLPHTVLNPDIERNWRRLSERERQVLTWFFGLPPATAPLSCEEIGHRLQLSPGRVQAIKVRALRKLRVEYYT